MENIFLEKPTLIRKQDALDYLEENMKYHSDLNGSGSMDMCLGGATYCFSLSLSSWEYFFELCN